MTQPWSNQSTSLLIVQSTPGGFSGFFVYSPVPGPGNLIGSWAGSAGVDPFGNPYPAGLASIQGNISGTTITGSSFQGTNFVLDNAGFRLYTTPSPPPPPPPPPPPAPVPFFVTGTPAAGTAAVQAVLVAHPTAAGDLIHVAACAASGGAAVTGVTDSKGNTYVQQSADATQIPTSVWVASGATTALTTSDNISVTYASTTGQKIWSACAVRGLPSTPIDQHVSNAGNSNNPSIASGALAEATETILAAFGTANGAGSPTLAGSLQLIEQRQFGGSQFLTTAYINVTSAASYTASATLGSSGGKWAALLTSLKQV